MALLSRTLLNDMGINLSDGNYASLSEHFQNTLDNRIIESIVDELTPEQAEELATLQGAGDQIVLEWLTKNVPDYSNIVADEVDILLGEIAEGAEQITP